MWGNPQSPIKNKEKIAIIKVSKFKIFTSLFFVAKNRKRGKKIMSELLFFILGLIIGGLVMTTLMCCLQINRINEYERLLLMRDKKEDDEEQGTEVVQCQIVE